MTTYAVADGHNQGSSTTALNPQPKTEGIKSTRRTYAADNTVYDEAKYVEFVYSMVPDVTTYQSILTAFGILNALTNDVTVDIRDATFTDVEKNGTAVQPRPGEDVRWNYFPRNVVILVKNLEDTA